MALKDDIALFQRLTIFRDLSEDHLRLLAFGAERRRIEPGRILFRQGEAADGAYVVTMGRIDLVRYSPSRGEHKTGEAGPGSMLTEIAMVAEVERQFSAVAAEASEVIRISRALFHRMLEEYPEVAVSLEGRLRENFTKLAADLEALSARFT